MNQKQKLKMKMKGENLAAELEITHHNRDLSTSQDQDGEHDGQEAKQVIELMEPDRREDEEKLDEDSTKRQDSPH